MLSGNIACADYRDIDHFVPLFLCCQ